MSRAIRQFVRNWREDGGLATVLLFIAVSVAGAGATVALTAALLGTRDTLMSYAPSDAMLYAHASRTEASRALIGTLSQFSIATTNGFPLRPYESAIYVVERDGMRHHAVMFGWRKLIGPTSDEMAFLKDLGAEQLDSRRFIVAVPELVTVSRMAHATGTSLAANESVSGVLSLAANGSLVQAYAQPRVAYGVRPPSAEDSDEAAMAVAAADALIAEASVTDTAEPIDGLFDLTSAEPVVISAGIRSGGTTFVARIMPVSLANASSPGNLGGADAAARLPATDGHRPLPLARIAAEVALTGPSPAFDVVSLFSMENPEGANSTYGGTEEAEQGLRAAFAAPYAAWFRPVSGRTTSYALHLPTVPADDAFAALALAYAAHRPEVRPFALPDEDSAYELVAKAPVAHPSTDGDARLDTDPAIIVGHDGQGGSFISNSAAMMDAMRGIATSALSNSAPCQTGDAQLRLAAPIAAKIPVIKPFIQDINGNPVVIHTAWGKGVFICGYLR